MDLSFKVYVPLSWRKFGINYGFIPQVNYSFTNNWLAPDPVQWNEPEHFEGLHTRYLLGDVGTDANVAMQRITASVRGYAMLSKAENNVYPRLGVGAELGLSVRPGLSQLFPANLYAYVYGYLPGLWRTQGLRLTGLVQQQLKPANGLVFAELGVNTLSRGFNSGIGSVVAQGSPLQWKLTADYAIPIYVGDISWFSPVAYVSHFLLIPHVDWLGFGMARNGKGSAEKSSLLSAGADLTVELGNFFWAPFPCSVGVSASWLSGPYFKTLAGNTEEGRKPFSIGLIFSMDI